MRFFFVGVSSLSSAGAVFASPPGMDSGTGLQAFRAHCLQVVKIGLKLPWTNDIDDTRIRCRLQTSLGTRIGKLTFPCRQIRHRNGIAVGKCDVRAIASWYAEIERDTPGQRLPGGTGRYNRSL